MDKGGQHEPHFESSENNATLGQGIAYKFNSCVVMF